MPIDRVALHEKIAFEKWEGYAKAIERGRRVTFGDKFIWAPNSVMMSPLFNDGVPQTATDMFSDEVAKAIEKYAPDGDILSPEWRMWWKHMPDYRVCCGRLGLLVLRHLRGDTRRRHGVGTARVGLHLDRRGRADRPLGLVRGLRGLGASDGAHRARPARIAGPGLHRPFPS